MAEETPYMDWSEVIKKEARGRDDEDLGEVQEVGQHYVLTQKGLVSKEKYYIPKYLVQGYDGKTLWFKLSGHEIKTAFNRDEAPPAREYDRYRTSDTPQDIETRIPVMGERLDVQKKVSTEEVGITKEPVTETKTVEVPVTHEEISVERRPADETTTTAEGPVSSRQEVKVPLKSEEVEVTKTPYVKEEVAVKKKPVTRTERVESEVTSERVDVEK
jgi:uncharacterized protein (TIGR02271 family)